LSTAIEKRFMCVTDRRTNRHCHRMYCIVLYSTALHDENGQLKSPANSHRPTRLDSTVGSLRRAVSASQPLLGDECPPSCSTGSVALAGYILYAITIVRTDTVSFINQ